MKYEVGQRVIDIEDCETGVITAIDSTDKRGPYTVQLDSGNVFQYTDRLLRRDSDELQAENERLRIALREIADMITPFYPEQFACSWRDIAKAALAESEA